MQLVASNPKIARLARPRRKSLAGQGVLILLALQIIFFSSFVAIDLPTATKKNLINWAYAQGTEIMLDIRLYTPPKYLAKIEPYLPVVPAPLKPVRVTLYSPQAPVAIFLGYVMGWPIATIAAALFILVGLIGPFFGLNPLAAGGGPDYYLQPSFGYLLGMVVATMVVAKITGVKRTSVRQVGAIVGGLISLHLTGIVYLIGTALLFGMLGGSRPQWIPWVFDQVRNLSWYPLFYDASFALLLVGVSFPLRYLVDILTAPDIALKTKNDLMTQQRIEELLQ